jgi:3-phenylpropionate/trans-cinnamate dioxygenase ferredoxin reductase subunit
MTGRTFVTVGAGQAAAVAARTLRRRGFDGRIVLIGDEPNAPYQRPPLSKEFLSGADTLESLMLLPQAWLVKNDVEIITGAEVMRVDPASRCVELDGHPSVLADAVLFATGGRPRTLPVPGPRPDLVHYLRTIEDSQRLRAALTPGKRVVLVGAGFVGLEIASTAIGLGVHVTVLEAEAVPLGRIVGPAMGSVVAGLHRDNGVDIRTDAAVSALRTTEGGVVVEFKDAPPLAADLAVVGIGIPPNVAVAAASGVRVDDGIVVDAQGRTSIPNVYAAGDVARRYSDRAGRHVRVEHFDNANKQGAAAANAMLGRHAVSDEPNWFWSDQYGRNIQFVGTASATGEVVIRGDLEGLDFTAFYLDGGTVHGAFTMDRGEDVMATRELLGRSVDTSMLVDESTDLWDLADTAEAVRR